MSVTKGILVSKAWGVGIGGVFFRPRVTLSDSLPQKNHKVFTFFFFPLVNYHF